MGDAENENPPAADAAAAEAPEGAAPAEGAPAADAAPAANDDKEAGEGSKLLAVPKIPGVKNPFDEEPYVPSERTDPDVYNLSPCCCCLCACSHDRVGEASCFGCFPIRCGVIFIAMFIFFLAVILMIVTFFQLANEYLPWWYTFVGLLLQVPLITAAFISVYFFAADKRTTRGKLRCSAILSIISVFLWAVWQIIFYLAIYKRDTVYVGGGNANDDSNYRQYGKKQYIFTFLAEAFIIIGFLAYFIAVISQYVTLMNAPHEKADREKAAAEKAAAADNAA